MRESTARIKKSLMREAVACYTAIISWLSSIHDLDDLLGIHSIHDLHVLGDIHDLHDLHIIFMTFTTFFFFVQWAVTLFMHFEFREKTCKDLG